MDIKAGQINRRSFGLILPVYVSLSARINELDWIYWQAQHRLDIHVFVFHVIPLYVTIMIFKLPRVKIVTA